LDGLRSELGSQVTVDTLGSTKLGLDLVMGIGKVVELAFDF
jgi:hypothetical protein